MTTSAFGLSVTELLAEIKKSNTEELGESGMWGSVGKAVTSTWNEATGRTAQEDAKKEEQRKAAAKKANIKLIITKTDNQLKISQETARQVLRDADACKIAADASKTAATGSRNSQKLTKINKMTKRIPIFERKKFGGWECSRVTARGCVLT